MASVSFFIRGKVVDKECTIWVRFRDKGIDIKVPVPYLKCKPKDWKDGKCKLTSKKITENDSETINIRLIKLETEIISKYNEESPDIDIKDWLGYVILPTKSKPDKKEYSDNVLLFIDDYISLKERNVAKSTIRKANVVKQLLNRYVEDRKIRKKNFKNLRFKDLDNSFKADFEEYCQKENYKISTTYRNLKFLKMICKVAESFDIEVHKHAAMWKFDIEKATKAIPKSIYLTFDELQRIEEKEMPFDYLDNAKDWLLIACYTAQRVSDYLRFTSSMIVEDSDGQKYLEFTQQKTNARMKIPLLKKVQDILVKRGGEFPRKISDVNLNLYIKQVCEIAGINEMIYNGKVMVVEREDNSKITRKVFGYYPKHELVTSHIGRKSFASNFYEKIPTAYLLNFTGHTTEKQLLTYINKTDVEKAKSTAEIFNKLGY
ncbi:MAG TPA: hypothetical protein DIT10_17100 [Chryseobacterium sp.]|nr:hypothetical protein [Chryseobacterium sp.]